MALNYIALHCQIALHCTTIRLYNPEFLIRRRNDNLLRVFRIKKYKKLNNPETRDNSIYPGLQAVFDKAH